ncbi:MAG: radical SAM protein [Bacteroidales bacterium]|nr:radical SAM protein [Bacteroidales bacterium]
MGTFLFDKIIFGPVHSRRLGISLGINLLPSDRKVCTFNCIYCECGWTLPSAGRKLPTRANVKQMLEIKLQDMSQHNELPDVITFAGNGEPSVHPDFAGIVDDTVATRDRFAPKCRIAVLSNATMLSHANVAGALRKIDDCILKLDSAVAETVARLNKPTGRFSIDDTIEELAHFGRHAQIQTLFLRGTVDGMPVDNTTDAEIEAWIAALHRIRPGKVMLYSISRDTPADGLTKVSPDELNRIAARLHSCIPDTEIQAV